MKSISREELYALVWQTPMYRLGEQFGVSGNGLAKICDRLAVPYPPRGYWAKKSVGKAPAIPTLPSAPKGIPSSTQICPTMPAAKPSIEQQSAGQIGLAKSVDVVVPDDLSHAHRIVREWVAEHKRKQKERAEEHKRRKRDVWSWVDPLIDDLTDRDLYRFRVSSAVFSGIEKAGGRIKNAPITGKVTFLIAEQDVECSIVEKLCRPLMMPTGESAKWTAFPEHHQTSLFSTGFLRVKVTSYLGRSAPDWIETKQRKIDAFLPEIIAGLMSAGVAMAELERKREEDRKRYLEAEARRQEFQRQQALEAERRQKLRQSSDAWHEAMRLRAFIDAVRQSDQNGRSLQLHLPLDDWCEWASSVADEIDPFKPV